MNKILFIVPISLLIIFSCEHTNKVDKTYPKEYLHEWIKNFRLEGGKLYDSVDIFEMKGIEEYKLDYIEKGQVLYGLKKIDSNYSITGIDAREFWLKAGIKPVIESKKYYKKDNYFINTDIFVEDVMTSRTVTYVHPDYLIQYDYVIINNNEFLSSVGFQYKNGVKKYYENTAGQTYIENDPYLKEVSIIEFFENKK